MDTHALSDEALLLALGENLRRRRLERNWTQEAMAERAGLDRMTVGALERGATSGPLSLLQLLRALGALDTLAALLEARGPSPLEVVRRQGRERQRASSARREVVAAGPSPDGQDGPDAESV